MGSTNLFVLFSCFIVTCSCYKAGPECFAPNEELSCAPICPPEKTCDTRNVEFDCAANTRPCKFTCVCKTGFYRNALGDCISSDECDLCPGDNEFFSCGSACDNVCNNLATQNRTRCPIRNIVCNRRCYCEDGFARDDNQNCVPVDECPKGFQEQQCFAQNEELSCEPVCPPERTCRNRDIKFNCLATNERCNLKCVCKPGFFRNAIGDCISGDECDQCPGANEFFSCGPECDNVCADLATQNRTNCPLVNVMCNRKCYCEDGFARDDNRNCVPVDRCPKGRKCADPNEDFKDCKQTCPPDSCFSLVARFKCDSNPKCEPGCNCKPGFLRVNDTSPCVPICSCPEMENSPDC